MNEKKVRTLAIKTETYDRIRIMAGMDRKQLQSWIAYIVDEEWQARKLDKKLAKTMVIKHDERYRPSGEFLVGDGLNDNKK